AMNAPAAAIGTTAANAAQVISRWGFTITPEMIDQTAKDIGETTILSRAGGAPTLAVGMAQILAQALGGKTMEAFWYHFAILFDVGNEMLAGIALLLCTSVLVKMKRERYVWVTLVPTAWLLVTTLTAGIEKIFHSDPRIGFLALANRFSEAAAQGKLLAPAKSIEEMQRVAF